MKVDKPLRIRNLYPVVTLTTVLLLVSIYLAYQNSQSIRESRKIAEEAEQVAVNTNNIIRYLHLADIGLRGYALVRENPQIRGASQTAKVEIRKTLDELDQSLTQQEFPHMDEYNDFKKSVEAYFSFVDSMFTVIDEGHVEIFVARLAQDPGYSLFERYVVFSESVTQFEDEVANRADHDYHRALRNSYLIQVVIFVLAVPLLFFGAYQTKSLFGISERLRQSEIDRRKLLTEQNVQLEKLVYERTKEIQAQNEEIQAQNEEITLHNEQLELQRREIEAKHNELLLKNADLNHANIIIQKQKEIIEQSNQQLYAEVQRQTVDLRNANTELIEHNNRLKQFSYIVSHNLRSPVARLLGLSSLLKSTEEQERNKILGLMTTSTQELDQIIRDINLILEIDKLNTQALNRLDVHDYLIRAIDLIRPDLEITGSEIDIQLNGIPRVPFLGPYMESILYNLISNAIKYRDPERKLMIMIRGFEEQGFVKLEISDNGLGIDLQRFEQDLFKLYKRFHTHVEGKGLGLYLVKSQLQALGGKLEVKSKVGEGTTFLIFFKK
ncbi:MAG: HAMP domain-containing sensor histidine kinase [Cyclobacteriaceae bacterium]|nr:MAG: HAMP domain-containing sensor histidine kinase [Cyclobacteriaceae bacterium]